MSFYYKVTKKDFHHFDPTTTFENQITEKSIVSQEARIQFTTTNVADIVTRDSMDVTGEIPDRQYWKISISDNGIGFEQQYADKIFELFQRLHTAKQYEGTGIGLAICKKIIKNHHGFISAVGDEQRGTTINIFLPLNKSSL